MIVIDQAAAVDGIKELVAALKPGRSRILVVALADKWEVEIACDKTYALTADFLSAVPKIKGVAEMREL